MKPNAVWRHVSIVSNDDSNTGARPKHPLKAHSLVTPRRNRWRRSKRLVYPGRQPPVLHYFVNVRLRQQTWNSQLLNNNKILSPSLSPDLNRHRNHSNPNRSANNPHKHLRLRNNLSRNASSPLLHRKQHRQHQKSPPSNNPLSKPHRLRWYAVHGQRSWSF